MRLGICTYNTRSFGHSATVHRESSESHSRCGFNRTANGGWNEPVKSAVKVLFEVMSHRRLAVLNGLAEALERDVRKPLEQGGHRHFVTNIVKLSEEIIQEFLIHLHTLLDYSGACAAGSPESY